MPKLVIIDVVKAQEMRERGASWDEIGEFFDCSAEKAHQDLDPEYRARRRGQIKDIRQRAQRAIAGNGTGYRAHGTDPGMDLALATVAPDTRTRLQKFFGDPPFSRSALGRRPTT